MRKLIEKIKRHHIREVVKALVGGAVGFALFTATSHPKSPVHQKIPHKKVKSISLFPSIKIHREDKHYHLHHWMNHSVIYLLLLALKRNLIKSKFLHGFIIGTIVQGLTYKDRFHIVHKYPAQKIDGK